MFQSLPYLRKELDKIHGPGKIDSDSKIDRYQKKMLQLLIREKTTLLQNEQLSQELLITKNSLNQAEKSLKSITLLHKEKQQENTQLKGQIERLTQTVENLDVQNKMNQMGRMSEQQKYLELQDQFKILQNAKVNIQNQLQTAYKDISSLKQSLQQKIQENELNRKDLSQKLVQVVSEKDQCIKKMQQSIQQWIESELRSSHMKISLLQEAQQKLQLKLGYFTSSQSSLKLRIKEIQQISSDQQSKINQLSKQLHLAKLKHKQYEENLYQTQIRQGQQSLEFSKLDKQNKRIKKELSTLEDKLKQLEQQKMAFEEKNQQLNRNYKNTKKELQRLKDSLSEANDNQSGTKSRIQKLQLSLKALRQSLVEKEQELNSLKQTCKQLQTQLQVHKTDAITTKFNLEESKKKYEVVAEARSIAQEKLVLQRQQHSKSLSSMIKEKDLSYRQNYKLLQLLEIKDKTIEKIIHGLKNVSELQKDICLEISPKENITKRLIEQLVGKDISSHKDRVRIIDQYLNKLKL